MTSYSTVGGAGENEMNGDWVITAASVSGSWFRARQLTVTL